MGVAYMALGTADELKGLLLDVALDRAFLLDPLPSDANSFNARVAEGRGRLTLIANEVARLCGTILTEHAAAQRKLTDSKPPAAGEREAAGQGLGAVESVRGRLCIFKCLNNHASKGEKI